MHAWEAIQNALNYMEDHLSENMKMETLANEAALSPYYFQRLFKRLVMKSVSEYVKLRRLAKASEDLKLKEKRILDVALDYGFSDHANFTRAFKEAYGITPEDFRACPVILNHFIKPDLLLNYIMVDEGVPLITEGIVLEVTRKIMDKTHTIIGVAGEVPDTELTGGKATGVATMGVLWDEFHRRKLTLQHLPGKDIEYGVLYNGEAREGCVCYIAGVEANENERMEGLDCYSLPCGEYVICGFEAENFSKLIGSAIFKASSFFNSWMKKHNLTSGDFITEVYYDTYPDSSYMELWLPLNSPQRKCGLKEAWDKTNGTQIPSMTTICDYVNNSLYDCLCRHLETEYQSKPVPEYSRCSFQLGWNVKYKKAGRTLCTLYPMEGYFIALIVIGDRERAETESMLPFFTDYVQQLYHDTKTGMGQKWLMIHVTEEAILEDVKRCIAIRRGKKS